MQVPPGITGGARGAITGRLWCWLGAAGDFGGSGGCRAAGAFRFRGCGRGRGGVCWAPRSFAWGQRKVLGAAVPPRPSPKPLPAPEGPCEQGREALAAFTNLLSSCPKMAGCLRAHMGEAQRLSILAGRVPNFDTALAEAPGLLGQRWRRTGSFLPSSCPILGLTEGCTKLCTKLDFIVVWVYNPWRKYSGLGRDHLCASGKISWICSCRHNLKVNRNIPIGLGSALTHEQKHLWR